MYLYKTIGSQRLLLPLHDEWTDFRLSATIYDHILELREQIRYTAIDVYCWKASFVFLDLDDMKDYIELMPAEAKNYMISIEVGLWGKAPVMIWALAKSLNIHQLLLIIHLNTSLNVHKQRINNLEFLYRKKALR